MGIHSIFSREEMEPISISQERCYCLGENSQFPFSNLFIDGDFPLKSDADEQLVINVGFRQTSRVQEIEFETPDDDSCPATIKLFVNKLNMGFDDVTGTLHFIYINRLFLLIHIFLMIFDTRKNIDHPPAEIFQLQPGERRRFKLSPIKWKSVDNGL